VWKLVVTTSQLPRCGYVIKKYGIANMVTSAVCWSLWKLRNAMIFQEVVWVGMKSLWQRVVPMLRCWRVLVPLVMEHGYDSATSPLEKVLMMPKMIEALNRMQY
jgi:hypothetical protein